MWRDNLAHIMSSLPAPVKTSLVSNEVNVNVHPKSPSLEILVPGKLRKSLNFQLLTRTPLSAAMGITVKPVA